MTESWLRSQPGVKISKQYEASSDGIAPAGATICDVVASPFYEKVSADSMADVVKPLSEAFYQGTQQGSRLQDRTGSFGSMVCRLDDAGNVTKAVFGVTGRGSADRHVVAPSIAASALYYSGDCSITPQAQLPACHLLIPLPASSTADTQKIARACNEAYDQSRTIGDKARELFGRDGKASDYAAALVVSASVDSPSEVSVEPAVSVFIHGRFTDIARAVRVARVIGGRNQSSATLCTPESRVFDLDLQSYTDGKGVMEDFRIMSLYFAALPDVNGN